MSEELEQLRRRSDELGAELGTEEAVETNAAILDLDPGDPKTTNRLGIGLLSRGRAAEAQMVLERGLMIHPENSIMRKRLEEAKKLQAAGAGGNQGKAPIVGWTDFEPEELVESSLAGPGRDACIHFCAASIRASENIDLTRTAVTPVKSGHRFRVIGGIFTGVAPWHDTLSIAVPVTERSVIEGAVRVGGQVATPAKAVPCVEVLVPRAAVDELFDELLAAHVEHLKLSLEVAPPTHQNKHHPGLRAHILDRADALPPR